MSSYYISDGSKKYGPFDRERVLHLIFDSKVSIFDFISDNGGKSWVRVIDHPDFTQTDEKTNHTVVPGLINDSSLMGGSEKKGVTEKTKSRVTAKTKRGNTAVKSFIIPDRPTELPLQEADSWQVKIGATIMGPYRYLKMAEMIQQGDLKDSDLVRKIGDSEWVPAKSRSEFSIATMKSLPAFRDSTVLQNTFFRRNEKRKNIKAELSVRTLAGAVFHAHPMDISAGGISFACRTEVLRSGDRAKIFINVRQGNELSRFECDCIVLTSRRFYSQAAGKGVLIFRYSAKFVGLSESFARWIENLPQ